MHPASNPMEFLLITRREIQLRSRQPALYWLRLTAGLLGILVCVPQLFFVAGPSGPQTGRGIYNGVTAVAFFLSCLAGLLTADAISSERRDGTLGLLVLTRVRLLDVVLGKLSSGLVTSLSGLMALIPLLMLPLLAGGVTGAEAFRRIAALLLTLFLSLSAGLLASSVRESLAHAAQSTVALIGTIILIPFLLLSFRPLHVLGWLSPLSAFFTASEFVYSAGAARDYWSSLAVVALLVCIFIQLSVALLRWNLQQPGPSTLEPVKDDPEVPEIVPEQLRWIAASKRLAPLEWMVARDPSVRRSFWTAAILVHFSQTAGYVVAKSFGAPAMAYVTRYLLFLSGAAFLAWGASRFFIEVRRSRQIELLLTTPGAAPCIISHQWKALRYSLAWPLMVMLTPCLIRGLMASTMSPLLLLISAVQLAYILCSVVATCWLGMFWGWKTRTQTAAVLCSVIQGAAIGELGSWAGAGLFPLAPGLSWLANLGQLFGVAYCLWICRHLRGQFTSLFPGNSVSWPQMFWFSLRAPPARKAAQFT